MKIPFKYSNITFFVIFLSFFWIRLFEYTLSGTFSAYKQIIICVMTLYYSYTCKSALALQISILSLTAMILLVGWSYFLKEIPISAVAYNSFNYISWIPFFLFGASKQGQIPIEGHWHKLFTILYFSSVAGVVLDYYYDIASHIQPSIVAWREYAKYSGDDVSRSEFFFGGSVKVIPQLIGICYLVITTGILSKKWSMYQSVLMSLPLILIFPYTNTTNAFLFALLFIFSVYFCIHSKLSKPFLAILLLCITILSILLIIPALPDLDGTRFDRPLAQIGLVKNQRYSDQESRTSFWLQSVSFFDSAPPLDVLLGDGIGTGGGPYSEGIISRGHGESSFAQSLFEGGIVATILRLLPFYIAIASFLRFKLRPKRLSPQWVRKNDISIINLSAATVLILFMINAVAPLMVYLPIHMYVGWIGGCLFRLAQPRS
jgi:hypothetical protein